MDELILNNITRAILDNYLANPTHAICLVGPPGAGKRFTAHLLAQTLLKSNTENIYIVGNDSDIGIEDIRNIHKFLKLKMPGKQQFKRAIIIQNAERMSIEAQNALLKTLEEPPEDTLIYLTAISTSELRPTIKSRCRIITILPLTESEAKKEFSDNNNFEKSYILSGGYVGILMALLDDSDHELLKAVNLAKQLLKSSKFERLSMIDGLIKSKSDIKILLYAISRVLGAVMNKASDEKLNKLTINQRAIYEAEKDLNNSANSKLLLTDLFLEL